MATFGPYPAVVVSVHDGDTARLDLDLGFALTLRYDCRMYGINAPELSTVAGKDALAYALTILSPGMQVSVVSKGWDKYGGRFNGIVRLPDGRDFAVAMVTAGHAVAMRY